MRYRPHEYQKYAMEYIETHPVAAVLLSTITIRLSSRPARAVTLLVMEQTDSRE